MAFRLYVGNYPCDFEEKDVKNLFQDFAGLVLERQVKKGMKCFSFFNCKDIDLLVSVIQKMHKADVEGRKLVVRAVEHNVQDYVEVLLKEIDTDDKKPLKPSSSLIPVQVMKHSIDSPQKREENGAVVREEANSLSDASNYQQEKNRPPLENKSVRASHGSYRQNQKNNSREMLRQVSYSPSKSSLDHQQNYKKSSNHESFQKHDERPQYQGRKLHKQAQYEEHYEKNSEDNFPDSSKLPLDHHQNYRKSSNHESFQTNGERPQYQGRKLDESAQNEEYNVKISENKYPGSSKSSLDHHQNYRKSSNHESFQTNGERPQYQGRKLDESAQNEEYNVKISENKYPGSSKSSLDHHQNYRKSSNQESFQTNGERPQYQGRKLDESVQHEEYYDGISENKYPGSSKSSLDHCQNYRKSSNHESFQRNGERPQYQDRKLGKSPQYEEYYDENSEDKYQGSRPPSQYTNSAENCVPESEIDCESPEIAGTWVSVSNFPFFTSTSSIYELFSDYQPIHVYMVSNVPYYRRSTEAHVCFPNQDIADDVIMNFDNTFYEGRLLVVNDMEDLTVLDELVVISSC